MQLFRHHELQNSSNSDDFLGYERILLTTLSYFCTLKNTVMTDLLAVLTHNSFVLKFLDLPPEANPWSNPYIWIFLSTWLLCLVTTRNKGIDPD